LCCGPFNQNERWKRTMPPIASELLFFCGDREAMDDGVGDVRGD